MLASKGFFCLNYIDDFLLVADDFQSCLIGLDVLVALIQSLGLEINWEKVECLKLYFLGYTLIVNLEFCLCLQKS